MVFRKLTRLLSKPVRCAEVLAEAMVDVFPHFLVVVSFLFFLHYNGGIVMGDKAAHEVNVHLPQIGYFFFFYVLFSLPQVPRFITPFLQWCRKNTVTLVALLMISVLAVHSNTLEHPYMLADNRHYTFYLWNKLYGRYIIFRYLMIPIYTFGAFMAYSHVKAQTFVFRAMFVVCLVAAVVPQKLIEFRYFIIPFLFLRSQYVAKDWVQIWTETVYYLLINAITLYIFISKTFMWEDDPNPQRIMW